MITYAIAKYLYWFQSVWFLIIGSYLLVPGHQRHCQVKQQLRVAQLLGAGFCASGLQILFSHDAVSLRIHCLLNFAWFLAVGPMRLDKPNNEEQMFGRVGGVTTLLLMVALVSGATTS